MVDLSSMIFDLFMLPLEKRGLAKARKELLKDVKGNILEVGAGTGVNVKYYNVNQVKSLSIMDIDISVSLRKKSESSKLPVKLIKGNAEEMPFSSESFDIVVVTLVLCTIPDIIKAMAEIHRVLKPDGKLIFLEHVISTDNSLAKLQNNLNTPWKAIASGCHLNRDTRKIIEQAGFKIVDLHSFWNDIFISGVATK